MGLGLVGTSSCMGEVGVQHVLRVFTLVRILIHALSPLLMTYMDSIDLLLTIPVTFLRNVGQVLKLLILRVRVQDFGWVQELLGG